MDTFSWLCWLFFKLNKLKKNFYMYSRFFFTCTLVTGIHTCVTGIHTSCYRYSILQVFIPVEFVGLLLGRVDDFSFFDCSSPFYLLLNAPKGQ